MDLRQILGKSAQRRLRLIEALYFQAEGIPVESLVAYLGCSLPVLWNDIKAVNDEGQGFFIEKRFGSVYLIKEGAASLGSIYSRLLQDSYAFQILEELLYERHEGIAELAEGLFLSVSNAQRYLKRIENALAPAGIQLTHRPLQLGGNEALLRHLYYKFFIEKYHDCQLCFPLLTPEQQKSIAEFIDAFAEENGFYRTLPLQIRLNYNLFISAWRIKNGHFFPRGILFDDYPRIPAKQQTVELKQTLQRCFGGRWKDEELRDLVWLTAADALVFSGEHRVRAPLRNQRYWEHQQIHEELVAEYAKLFGGRLTREEQADLVIVLQNATFLYPCNGPHIEILRKNQLHFTLMMQEFYGVALEQIAACIDRVTKKHDFYREEDFRHSLLYWLVSAVPDSLRRLQHQEIPLRVLLITRLSPTEEAFLTRQLEQTIYGNLWIDYLRDPEESLPSVASAYDLILSTAAIRNCPEATAFATIDPYLTWPSLRSIQQLVDRLYRRKRCENPE